MHILANRKNAMPGRRDLLRWTSAGLILRTPVAALFWCAGAKGQALAQEGAGKAATGKGGDGNVPVMTFRADTVAGLAEGLASKAYKFVRPDLPASLAAITPLQAEKIRFRPERRIWQDGSPGFVLEPIHRSRLYPAMVPVFLVEKGAAAQLPFRPGDFDYGGAKLPAISADAGIAGIRILYRNGGGTADEVARFYGPDLFQAIGRNQTFGLAARPVIVRTENDKGEERVELRAIWVERPAPADSQIVLHGLLDAPSFAGALRMTVRPGAATITDSEITIFPRRNIARIGIAGMAASHFTNGLGPRVIEDVRPAAHEASGLEMHSGANEWIWRPVINPARLQVSAFTDPDVQGFGFLQRNRQFVNFLDDRAKWHRRPSLWVKPIGTWGPGQVTLFEVPSRSAANKNVLAYWHPKESVKAGQRTRFVYRQFWSWTPPEQPPLAIVTRSRRGKLPREKAAPAQRVLVGFSGANLFADGKLRNIAIAAGAGKAKVLATRLFAAPDAKSVFAVMDFDPGSEQLAELRLQLRIGDAPASETWLFRWTP